MTPPPTDADTADRTRCSVFDDAQSSASTDQIAHLRVLLQQRAIVLGRVDHTARRTTLIISAAIAVAVFASLLLVTQALFTALFASIFALISTQVSLWAYDIIAKRWTASSSTEQEIRNLRIQRLLTRSCPQCSYALTGLSDGVPHTGSGPSACPECGTRWPLVPPALPDERHAKTQQPST